MAACMPQGEQREVRCGEFSDYGYYCVPYYQCNAQNKIITDGVGLVDPRQAGDLGVCQEPDTNLAVTSKCTKLLEVCCRHPQYITPSSCSDRGGNTPDDSDIFGDDDVDDEVFGDDDDDIFGDDDDIFGPDYDTNIPEDYDDGIFGIGPETGTAGQCGKRNNAGLANSLDKSTVDDARFGEWPHVCAVLKKEFIGNNEKPVMVYQCGASLISDSVVLTAGHCVNDTQSLAGKVTVRCGEWDTQSEDEPEPYQEVEVDRIQIHPNFNVDNHHNNFAVLFLKNPFTLSSHISPVCLPKPGERLSQQNCVSHGWGKDKFGAEGRYSTILKEVVVPLVDNEKCQKDLRENTRLGLYFELDSSFLCAGGQKDVDTCKGDGGSPLTCRQPGGPWFQAGIVSWGIGCGENNTPAVYANVAKASCWIDKAVQCYLEMEESYFGFEKRECSDYPDCLSTL